MEETKHIVELSPKMYKLPVALISVIAIFLAGYLIYAFKSLPQNYPKEISVSGEGKAYIKPDVATVNLGTNTQGFNSQDVVERNNKVINDIINLIKEAGIDQNDIKTTLYNLMPVYDWTETGRIFKGYSLDQQVQVKIRDFSKISDVLDKATSAGANTIGDLQFTVDDMQKAKAQARMEAIKQAKEKAKILASQSGLKLGKLINIYENDNCCVYPQPAYGRGGADVKESLSIPPQIEPGQSEMIVNVNLVYRVK